MAVGAGHEVATHATTGEVGATLGHLGLRSGNGGSAGVASTLLLVATGDVDHGGSIESCTRAGTDTDADTGAAYGL